MDINYVRSVGELVRGAPLAAHSTAMAAVTGLPLDRFQAPGARGWMPLSMAAMVRYNIVLTATDVLTFNWSLSHSNDNGVTDPYTVLIPVLTTPAPAIGPVAAGTYNGCITFNVPLTSAKRWVRFDYTPAGPAGAIYSDAIGAFGGWDHLPAPSR